MPYKATKVQFSLFYPSVDAETHDDIVPDVIGPLHELLCENQFHLVDSSTNRPLCENKSSDFGIDKRFYGNPNYSVLMQAPIVVTDEALGDVGWMSWEVYFYVLQVGQPMVDMATLGNPNERPDGVSNDASKILRDAEVVNVMTDVMALTLQVSLMEGDFDNKLSVKLPQAHASMPGEEVATWISHGRFPTNTTIPTLSAESTVAMFMEKSHAIRYTGATMFVIVWSLVYGMDRLARRRRRQRGADLEKTKEHIGVVPWATEDDVGKMLALGRKEIIRSWEKATTNKTSSSPMVIVPGNVRIKNSVRRC
jgi:hypothetical protein